MIKCFTNTVIILILSILVLFPVEGDLPGDQNLTPADTQTPVPVGILVMKSGFIADIGTEDINAIEMALEDNPGSLLHPVIADGGSEHDVAVETWQNMKNSSPGLPIVMTVSSWTSNVVYPDAADSGIVQVALGSAAVNRSHESDRLIRFTPGVDQESPVLASYLEQFDRIVVVGGENDYSREYFSVLERILPGKIVLQSRYNQNDVNSSLNITEIKQADPDVLVLLSVSEGGTVISLLRDGGVTVPLVGTRTIERNSLAGIPQAEGFFFTTPVLNKSHPFFTRYYNKFGENATFYGAEAYDAMTTLNSAVSACGNSSDCIYSWYNNRSYNGTLGTVTFNDQGIASYPVGFRIIHDGEIEDFQGF